MAKRCEHEETKEGPRSPLRYGSAPTEVCAHCGQWRMVHFPNCIWRDPPVDTNFEDVDE